MLTVKRLIKINKYKNKYTQFKISYIKSHSMLFNRKSSPSCWLLARKGTRDPLTHNITDLRISKDILIRSHDIPTEYSSFCFSDNLLAKAVTNFLHSSPIPPFVPKMRGVKLPCSISNTRWLYSRFFAASCWWNISVVFLVKLDCELTCVTRISKNDVWPRLQKPFALNI